VESVRALSSQLIRKYRFLSEFGSQRASRLYLPHLLIYCSPGQLDSELNRYDRSGAPDVSGESHLRQSVEHLPHALRRRRHIDVARANPPVESVHDSVYHRWRRADGAGLARAFDAERI